MLAPKVNLLAATARNYRTAIEALLLIKVKKAGKMGLCSICKKGNHPLFAATLTNEPQFVRPQWRRFYVSCWLTLDHI